MDFDGITKTRFPVIEKWAKDKLNELLRDGRHHDPGYFHASFGVPPGHIDHEAEEAIKQAFVQDQRFAGTILRWAPDDREIYIIKPNGKEIIKHPTQ